MVLNLKVTALIGRLYTNSNIFESTDTPRPFLSTYARLLTAKLYTMFDAEYILLLGADILESTHFGYDYYNLDFIDTIGVSTSRHSGYHIRLPLESNIRRPYIHLSGYMMICSL